MPTARELLEQADALMRRNRSLANDDIPVLTEAVPEPLEAQVLRGRGAQARPGTAVVPVLPDDNDGDTIPTLTERVETALTPEAPPDDGGDPSDWLQQESGEPSVTGDVPDSVLMVPAAEDASIPADASIFDDSVAPAALRTRSRGLVGPEPVTEDIEVVAPFSVGAAEDAFDEEFARAAQMVEAEAAEEAEATEEARAAEEGEAAEEAEAAEESEAADEAATAEAGADPMDERSADDDAAAVDSIVASEIDAAAGSDDVPSPEQVEAQREMASLASFDAGDGSFERWRAFEDAAPGAADPDAFLAAADEPVAEEPAAPGVPLPASDATGGELESPAPADDALPMGAEPSLPALNEALEEVEPPIEVIDLPAHAATLPDLPPVPSGPSFALPEPSSPFGAVVAATTPPVMAAPPAAAEPAAAARDDAKWEGIAEEIRMQVLQRIDIFTDTGLREQLAVRLQPIVDRASADLVATINQHVGELLRSYVAEAIEREIESWRRSH